MVYDLLLKGGVVIDGTGASPRKEDVGLKGDKIESIGKLNEKDFVQVLNVEGCYVCPGFIDTHVHSDVMLLDNPVHEAKIFQGVTTEILGQDGISYAPLSPEKLQLYREYLAGVNGNPPIDWNWVTFAEFRSKFNEKVTVNTAHLVTHGAIRLEIAGMEDRQLNYFEMKKACELIATSMEEGAVGFSTGLSYFPPAWADTNELIEMCKVVKDYNGVFVIHLRTVFRGKPFNPIEEALEIARQSGVKIHFSHFRTSIPLAGKVQELLLPLEKGIAEGLDISLDLYPYPQGSSALLMLLPPWVNEGGPKKVREKLYNFQQRKKMSEEIQLPTKGVTWKDIIISHFKGDKEEEFVGKSIEEIAEKFSQNAKEAICHLLIYSDLEAGFLIAPPSRKDLCEQLAKDQVEILSRPYSMVGSDGIMVGSKPHPRGYGTFPRFLGRYRKKYNLLSMEAMINRMTKVPADRFGLIDRGVLDKGKSADLLVFRENFQDRATYENPKVLAEGLDVLIINGQIVIKNNIFQGKLPGRALSRLGIRGYPEEFDKFS